MSDTRVDLDPCATTRPLLVAQVTDTHLGVAHGSRLAGMDTDASFAHVLGLVRAAPRRPDLLLATGDLASNGAPPAYVRVRDGFGALGVPWFWLPGNHDAMAAMSAVVGRGRPMVRDIRAAAWQIVMLDSTVPGEVGGRLGDEELARLERLLADDTARHVLVCLHHQPVPVGCAWLDEQRVADAGALFALLARHRRVRALLWGHVHQEFSEERDGLLLLGSPSTCIQFAPGSDRFLLDDRAPGMRWLELHPDGRIDTRVERVRGVDFGFDRDSAGYL
ncbi:MAG: 3',5'-cyclic adenosine monophosphate phosphodiesterase CpdA [Pseudomonadales bacterium]|nr:3',5'-cyclic adenosine monophosphate phosphodiesterase CpdA [Pseudomonadales bacterium]